MLVFCLFIFGELEDEVAVAAPANAICYGIRGFMCQMIMFRGFETILFPLFDSDIPLSLRTRYLISIPDFESYLFSTNHHYIRNMTEGKASNHVIICDDCRKAFYSDNANKEHREKPW